jgi:hypothetical protein
MLLVNSCCAPNVHVGAKRLVQPLAEGLRDAGYQSRRSVAGRRL